MPVVFVDLTARIVNAALTEPALAILRARRTRRFEIASAINRMRPLRITPRADR